MCSGCAPSYLADAVHLGFPCCSVELIKFLFSSEDMGVLCNGKLQGENMIVANTVWRKPEYVSYFRS